MKQSGNLNPSEESGIGCPVTSKHRRTPPNKHRGVGRQEQPTILEKAPDVVWIHCAFTGTLIPMLEPLSEVMGHPLKIIHLMKTVHSTRDCLNIYVKR